MLKNPDPLTSLRDPDIYFRYIRKIEKDQRFQDAGNTLTQRKIENSEYGNLSILMEYCKHIVLMLKKKEKKAHKNIKF